MVLVVNGRPLETEWLNRRVLRALWEDSADGLG